MASSHFRIHRSMLGSLVLPLRPGQSPPHQLPTKFLLVTVKNCLIYCSFFAVSVVTSGSVQAESWTDLNGTTTIEAKMVGAWADSIVLQLQNGRRVTVKLENLQASSRIQARGLAKELQESRAGLIGELKAQAAAAAAPAPNPLPKYPDAPAYAPLPAGADAVAQSVWLAEQTKSGHLIAMFDVLPKSYQDDVETLVKAAVKKIGVSEWQGSVGSLQKVGDLVVTRQNWFFQHPRFKVMTEDSRDRMRRIILTACGALRETLDPQAMDLTAIESVPLRQWLLERDKALAPYLNVWNTDVASLAAPTFELDKEEEGLVVVKVTAEGQSMQATFSKVEDRWVQEEMSKAWAENVAAVREEIRAAPEGSLLSTGVSSVPMVSQVLNPGLEAMLQPLIGRMESANSEREFLAGIGSLFDNNIQPMLSMVATMSKSNSRDSNGSDYGYDEEAEMEAAMEAEMEAEMREQAMRSQRQGQP